MNKKKIIIISASVALAVVLIVTIVLLATCKPTQPTPPADDLLAVPQNLAVDEQGVVSWSAVDEAIGYQLNINDTTVDVSTTQYNLNDFEPRPTDKVFRVKVRALAQDESKHSQWSSQITYTLTTIRLSKAQFLGINNGVISWTPNTLATDIVLTVNGVAKDVDVTAGSYDLSQETGEELVVAITFKGDGDKYTDSQTVTVLCNTSSQTLQLPAPTNARMENDKLVFDEVVGADKYYLRNYNNTVFTVTNNVVDMSSLYLVESVYAASDSDAVLASEVVTVTYFTQEQGQGTLQSPYLISNADEFRYIEYYEGKGEGKYYQLTADIVFDELQLDTNQVGSNAYRFGSFSGNLDGNGKALVNLTVYYSDGYSSLFDSVVDGAVITDLVIEDADWRTWTIKSGDGIMHEKGGDVAILCHTNRGTIQNVTVKGSSVVAEADGASSLVTINRGTVSGCVVENSVYIKGTEEAGGIVTYNAGTVTSCINRGTVSGDLRIGGIVGRNTGLVQKCDNYGLVEGNKQVGGIVGYNDNVMLFDVYEYNTMVKYCSNQGTVQGASQVGGIVGVNGNDGTQNGVAALTGAGIYYCYNTGNVYAASVLGGIVGNNFATTSDDGARGVVGSFSAGKVSVDSTLAVDYNRIYLNSGITNSWITNDGATIYCHYWGTDGGSVWPGEKMEHFVVDGINYYYIDIPKGMSENVVFTRRSEDGTQEYNHSGDIRNSRNNNMYEFTTELPKTNPDGGQTMDGGFNNSGGWYTATENVVNGVSEVVGALAGYSAELSDCYYLDSVAAVAGIANEPLQGNTLTVNGQPATDADMQKDATQLSSDEFVALLNQLAGENVWVKGDSAPKFSWQV